MTGRCRAGISGLWPGDRDLGVGEELAYSIVLAAKRAPEAASRPESLMALVTPSSEAGVPARTQTFDKAPASCRIWAADQRR